MCAMGKDRSLLLTSAFAKYCGTTRDTLLWYDRQGLLKPAMVGENGYRYYTAAQLAEYDMISLLAQAGNSLPEIRTLLREGGQDPAAVFASKASALQARIEELTRMQALAGRIAAGIRAVQHCRPGVPELVELEAAVLALTPLTPEARFFGDETESMEAFNRHLKMGAAQPAVFRYPLGTILDGADFVAGTYTDRALFFDASGPCECQTETRPAGSYVQIFLLGDFDGLEATMTAVRGFMHQAGLRPAGEAYEYDMLTFLAPQDGLGFATQFLIPVEKSD